MTWALTVRIVLGVVSYYSIEIVILVKQKGLQASTIANYLGFYPSDVGFLPRSIVVFLRISYSLSQILDCCFLGVQKAYPVLYGLHT